RSRMRAANFDEPGISAQAAMKEDSASARPDAQASGAQQREIVRRALGSLQLEQRQVIERAYYDGMSHSEIAAALNKPLGTVKTYIRQGLLRLRDSLRELNPTA